MLNKYDYEDSDFTSFATCERQHRLDGGRVACEYCHTKGNGACIQKDDMQELYPLMNEAEVLVLAAPIYYFTLCAQIQAPIQRMYCVNKPAKVKKMALLMSSYSPGVYEGAMCEFRDICNYWSVENMGAVTAKIDEQKTEETKNQAESGSSCQQAVMKDSIKREQSEIAHSAERENLRTKCNKVQLYL